MELNHELWANVADRPTRVKYELMVAEVGDVALVECFEHWWQQ